MLCKLTDQNEMIILRLRTVHIAFLCLFAVLLVVSGQARMLWRLGRISADPVATTGRVTGLHCHDHGRADYSFEIGGVAYDGRNNFVDGINCADARIGQPVGIYYENGAPDNNYALYPADTSGNRARTAFFTGLAFFGTFISLGPLLLARLWTWLNG
jgi:hypothetical protein